MINLTVELRNPPGGAENWSLTLCDRDITVLIPFVGRNGKQHVGVSERLAFEVPGGLALPLRVVSLQITKWNETRTALIELYYAQSIRPTLWDWDQMKYGTEPDPTYREIFIPSLGSYYFDVATEEMVLTGAAPVTQDWFTPLVTMALLMGMVAIIAPAMREGFE